MTDEQKKLLDEITLSDVLRHKCGSSYVFLGTVSEAGRTFGFTATHGTSIELAGFAAYLRIKSDLQIAAIITGEDK